MELSIQKPETLKLITESLGKNDDIISFVSEDIQDMGHIYNIKAEHITCVEDDIDLITGGEGMMIWWKYYSSLEGKYITYSASFKYFSFGASMHNIQTKEVY